MTPNNTYRWHMPLDDARLLTASLGILADLAEGTTEVTE